MPDRLSSLDVSFLYLEDAATAMHTGSVMVFEAPEGGLDHAAMVDHIEACIAPVPRYRQRVRAVPGRLANPVWVEDEQFDISYHVRRSALPRPGTREQLQALVARVQAQRLDRSRPLWEVVVVEGLEDNRFALVTKVHQAMVDGVATVDLGQIILESSPGPASGRDSGRASGGVPSPAAVRDDPLLVDDGWSPPREPSDLGLLAEAITDLVRRPGQFVDTVRSGLNDVRSVAAQVTGAVPGLISTARHATRSTPRSPLNRAVTEHRRFVMLETELEDYRAVRAGAPGATVNDVVLATLTGALRAWLLTRAEPVRSTAAVRTLVPVSVRVEDPAEAPELGSRVASLLVDLPTGEPSPLVRLHQIAYQTKAHRDTGQAVAAPTLAGIAGFAPPTLHALGARVASGISTRMFSLVVTNVPGPQQRLYLVGAPMLATYPVVPLFQGQALSVGVTSYSGRVYYGLNGDRDAMSDLDVLAQCILDALSELREAVPR